MLTAFGVISSNRAPSIACASLPVCKEVHGILTVGKHQRRRHNGADFPQVLDGRVARQAFKDDDGFLGPQPLELTQERCRDDRRFPQRLSVGGDVQKMLTPRACPHAAGSVRRWSRRSAWSALASGRRATRGAQGSEPARTPDSGAWR